MKKCPSCKLPKDMFFMCSDSFHMDKKEYDEQQAKQAIELAKRIYNRLNEFGACLGEISVQLIALEISDFQSE